MYIANWWGKPCGRKYAMRNSSNIMFIGMVAWMIGSDQTTPRRRWLGTRQGQAKEQLIVALTRQHARSPRLVGWNNQETSAWWDVAKF